MQTETQMRQKSFLVDKSGKFRVDFIGRFENLQKDFQTICAKLKIEKQELPHRQKTNHLSYQKYYDEETKQLVADIWAEDIEAFNYSFEKEPSIETL